MPRKCSKNMLRKMLKNDQKICSLKMLKKYAQENMLIYYILNIIF